MKLSPFAFGSPRALRAAVILALLGSSLALVVGPVAARPSTFDAVADTQINSAKPDTNYGSDARMATGRRGAPTRSAARASEKRSLVKFTVAGLDGTVRSARLRYYAVTTPVPALTVKLVTDNSWTETDATWANASTLATAAASYSSSSGSTRRYYEADVTGAVAGNGTYSFVILNPSSTTVRLATRESTAPRSPPQLVVEVETTATSTSAGTSTSTSTSTTSTSTTSSSTTSTTLPTADPVLVAAGDISTHTVTGGNRLTSDLVLSIDPDLVLTLGDNQYTDGTLQEFLTYYDPTWGRFKDKTRPGVGNHEYQSDPTAAGYFTYFGQAASPLDRNCLADCKGYYSFDVGSWHVIALNSNHLDCAYVACGPGSEQIAWLQRDLAATSKRCVLAYWHHPRWSSGTHHGSDPAMSTIWRTLYRDGTDAVDVILNGHEHNYERFAKLDPSGAPDPRGMRQFVVGTGGNALYGFGTPLPGSEARDATSKGVLRLTLKATGYDWAFVPAAGSSYRDSGTGTCN